MATRVTLYLDSDGVEEVRRFIKDGQARSQSAFIEEALRFRIEQIRRERWRQDMVDAGKDPLLLADVDEIEREFAPADAEAARMIQ